jgi:hypothetical protein
MQLLNPPEPRLTLPGAAVVVAGAAVVGDWRSSKLTQAQPVEMMPMVKPVQLLGMKS